MLISLLLFSLVLKFWGVLSTAVVAVAAVVAILLAVILDNATVRLVPAEKRTGWRGILGDKEIQVSEVEESAKR